MKPGKAALATILATLAFAFTGAAFASGNNDQSSNQQTPIMQCLATAIETGTDPEACKALAGTDNQAVNSPVMKCLDEALKNGTDPMMCRMYTDPTPDPEVEKAAGAIVCFTRLITAATKPFQCTKYITHYLSIADYDAGVFDPHDTYTERGDFLNKCKKCRRNDILRVQLTYGHTPPTANL